MLAFSNSVWGEATPSCTGWNSGEDFGRQDIFPGVSK